MPTSVDDQPLVFALFQNAPNPFNPRTQIAFSLPHDTNVDLRIFDARGRLIKVLMDEEIAAGLHSVIWSGKDESERRVATGIYFYRIEAEGFRDQRKMF